MQAGGAPAAAAAAPAAASAAGGGGGAPAAGDARWAAGHAQAPYVYIKRAGGAAADGEVYAKLAVLPGDDVADLAARACAAFGWGTPSQARLYLVVQSEVGGEAPSADDEKEALAGNALFPAASLQRAGVRAGALLLARVPPPAPAAAPALAAAAAAAAAAAGASFLAQPPPPHLVWPRFHAHAPVGACSISQRAAHSAARSHLFSLPAQVAVVASSLPCCRLSRRYLNKVRARPPSALSRVASALAVLRANDRH
jgi:hypothetical protein